jgi:hypothetical protein
MVTDFDEFFSFKAFSDFAYGAFDDLEFVGDVGCARKSVFDEMEDFTFGA